MVDAGLATPSGMSSVGLAAAAAGGETPELLELRKRRIEAEMEVTNLNLKLILNLNFILNLILRRAARRPTCTRCCPSAAASASAPA